ncbi:MAG: hypothetical protein FWC78_09435 [Defluviitaleaceae bacterium]|nr:hypothetical protein [Defluviitaleaceae bacterium]
MGMRELAHRMFVNFFVIFFLILLLFGLLAWLQGIDVIQLNFVFSIMALSFFVVLTEIVFYSKRELTRREMLLRHLFCLLLVIAVTMVFLHIMGVAVRDEPMVLLGNILGIFTVYMISAAIDFFRAMKSANQIAEKLKERYRM